MRRALALPGDVRPQTGADDGGLASAEAAMSALPRLLSGLAALSLSACPAADALAQQQRRLVLDIELQRQGPVQQGAERGEQRLTQRWQLSALLHSDGVPMPHNPLDPQDPQDPQRQLQAAGVSLAAPGDPAALQARAQAAQMRCAGDTACLMREAAALTATISPPPGVNPGSQGRPRAAAPDGAPPTPYLLFTGPMACGLQLTASLDERIDGSFNDVQGVVRFSETAQGRETRRDDLPCPTLQAVLDTRTGRLWTALATVAQDVQGRHRREVQNRPAREREGRLPLRWMEAQDWLQQRLQRLSAEGSDQARLPAGSGEARIRLRWSFRPA